MKDKNLTRSNKLKAYSALAGSLTMIGNASNAQTTNIIYIDITDSTYTEDGTYMLDLDNDASVDFEINLHVTTTSAQVKFMTEPGTVNEAAITFPLTSSGNNLPLALNANDSVNDKLHWVHAGNMYLVNLGGGANEGNWKGKTNKYIPLRLNKGINDTLYGWVRLSVPLNGKTVTIHDYAYDSIPNQGIKAGVITNPGMAEFTENKNIHVRTFDRKVVIDIASGSTRGTAVITNILGQEVKNVTIAERVTTLDLGEATSGVYFVTIKENNAITNKKIYIY